MLHISVVQLCIGIGKNECPLVSTNSLDDVISQSELTTLPNNVFGLLHSVILQGQLQSSFFGHLKNSPILLRVVDQPFEYQTIGNLNFNKFGIQMFPVLKCLVFRSTLYILVC